MRSRIWSPPRPTGEAMRLGRELFAASVRHQVTLRAAEASFFLITSAVPFLSLLLSFTGALLPPDPDALVGRLPLSGDAAAALRCLLEELTDTPGAPLLSVSAAATLWSASRGISAVRQGLGAVFGTKPDGGPVERRLKPVFATLAAAVILASLLLTLNGAVTGRAPRIPEPAAGIVGFIFLTSAAVLLYRSAGGRCGIWRGALFTAGGWTLFSLLPASGIPGSDGSVVYGAFAAVTMLMLRLYFRMLLLLFGAELCVLGTESATKEANRF